MFIELENRACPLTALQPRSARSALSAPCFCWVPSELLAKIEITQPDAHARLLSFSKGYEEWHQFHVRVDALGHSGTLSASEQEEQISLIERRDETRRLLVEGLSH